MQLLEHFNELSLHPKNAKELKGLILQLAIQGKLTNKWREDNPNIEPATILLERISAEKEKLIKEKSLRNVKSLPIDNDHSLGSIPETWAWARMIDYLDVRDGTHDSPKYVEEGFPLVTSKNLYTKKLDMSNVKYISQKDHEEISKRSKVDKDDILFAMIGSIGNPVLVDVEPNFSIKNVALIKYYRRDLCEPTFILNFLENATKEFKADSDGAVQSFISLNKLRLKEIPIPPLEEQKAIVEVVNQLFAEVDQLETFTKERIHLKEDFATSALKQLSTGDTSTEWAFLKEHFYTFFTEKSNIKKLRESILQLAVQGKLTSDWRRLNPDVEHASLLLDRIKKEKEQLVKEKKIKKENPLPKISDEEIPYEIPEGWVWCRLGQAGYTQTGNTPRKNNPAYFGDFIPFIGPADISNNWMKYPSDGLSKEGIEVGRLIPKDSLMMVCIGGSIGKCNITEIEVSCNQQINTITPILNLPVILRIVCQSPYFQNEVWEKSSGSATPIINKGKWENIPIPLPSIEEQKAIVQKVNSLMALCDDLEAEIEISKTTQEKWMESSLREVFEGDN